MVRAGRPYDASMSTPARRDASSGSGPPAGRGRAAADAPTSFVGRLVGALASDVRVYGLWLEGDDDTIQWPPYRVLDLHLAVAEPDLQSVRKDLAQILEVAEPGLRDFSQQDAPLQGYAGTATLADGTPLRYRLERTSQIAKVPRRAVNVLLDRSGGLLIPALSFEPRG